MRDIFGSQSEPSRITSSQIAAIGADIAEIVTDSRGDAWARWYTSGSGSWSEWRFIAHRVQAAAITGSYGPAAAPDIPDIPEDRELPDGPGATAELARQIQELRAVLAGLRAAVTARPAAVALVIVTTGAARRHLALTADGLADVSL